MSDILKPEKILQGDKEALTAHETIQKYGEAGPEFELEKDGQVYQGREVAVKSEPLIDAGTGQKCYIRNFIFHKNPEYKGRNLTNQEIFNWHWREVSRWLWGDGMTPVESIEPKITHFPASRNPKKYPFGGYMITIVCQARFGVSALDDSQTLQEILPHKSLPKVKR